MQRERLEGWMVKQIEQADLARGTVIQLPSRANTAPAKPTVGGRSPRLAARGLGSPRRGCGVSGLAVMQRPETQAERPPLSPGERIRQRHMPSHNTSLQSASAAIGELDGEDSVARQWRLHFQDPNRPFREDKGKVDRTQALKSPRRRDEGEVEDEGDGGGEDWEDAVDDATSPLASWGISREYVLEYIRQSVMPTAWATHARFSGEWEAVPPSEADGRYAANDTDDDGVSPFLTSLPPLSARSKTPHSPERSPTRTSSEHHRRTTASPTRSFRRPHPGASIAVPSSPRHKPPRCEERIHRVLAELRADPKAWDAFQKEVQRFLDDQRRKQHESNKIRENKQRASISPRAPVVLAERKRRRDERAERTQRHRQLVIQHENARLEAMVLAYRRRTQATNQSESDAPRDATTTVGYRRRKMWLVAVAFALATTSLQHKLLREKQRQVLEKMQTRAARVIQGLWKKWKWRHASKQTIVIYTWLRKCLWKLMFKMRCRRKRRHATALQRFMLDHFSGSRETRNFNRMMLKWRTKVICSQRLGLTFVQCSRARLAALTIWWDALDHERQRSERQGHDRHLPLADEKEAEWNALVSSARGRLSIRRPSAMGVSSRSVNISPTGGTTPSTTAGSPTTTTTVSVTGGPLNASGGSTSPVLLSRRSVSTRQLLDQMDERLTTMQQVLTPIEIQRLQQHACHVVKIPKAIKLRLLQELLSAARKDYIRKLSLYQEQAVCASYAREVKLDDARAIVQGSGTWGSLLIDTKTGKPKLRKPVFQLFSGGDRRRTIEELIRHGVQLTLESDPEQRTLVERQRQQRLTLEAGVSPLGSGGGGSNGSVGSSAMTSARKRESNVATGSLTPQPPSGSSGSHGSSAISEGSGRKTARKLTFAVPATIREKAKRV